MKKYVLTFIFILLLTFQISAPGLWRKENNQIIYSYQLKQLDQYLRTVPFTIDHLNLALEINIIHPDIVYKQVILETGWFKSQSFTEYNNLFGMKLPRKRITTATGKALHHAKYNHWYDAVIDYKYYQQYYDSLGYNMDNYYLFLEQSHYSTSKNYIRILKKL